MTGVRDATVDDLPAILAIQNAFIATEAIEWTATPHTLEGRQAWFALRTSLGMPVLVAVDTTSDEVVGFGSFADFRDTSRWEGYRFTVEHTVHVRQDRWGGGIASLLLEALAERARTMGKHVMVAAVEAGNEVSLRLHERNGFVEVGRMPQVGAKLGRWLDLVFLQRTLDDAPTPPS